MAYRSLPKFNPEARFIATRAFNFDGRHLAAGEPAEGIPERRLRQLFELRKVSPAAERKPSARKGKK